MLGIPSLSAQQEADAESDECQAEQVPVTSKAVAVIGKPSICDYRRKLGENKLVQLPCWLHLTQWGSLEERPNQDD